ncbi:MAG TPA: hypothetical protein VKB76_15480, partial [Ktedonobacterales bacterium]|nr:hypothetical protein [Ktedonobacterales bacterium]
KGCREQIEPSFQWQALPAFVAALSSAKTRLVAIRPMVRARIQGEVLHTWGLSPRQIERIGFVASSPKSATAATEKVGPW